MGYSHLDVKLTTMGCKNGVARRVYTGFAQRLGEKHSRRRCWDVIEYEL